MSLGNENYVSSSILQDQNSCLGSEKWVLFFPFKDILPFRSNQNRFPCFFPALMLPHFWRLKNYFGGLKMKLSVVRHYFKNELEFSVDMWLGVLLVVDWTEVNPDKSSFNILKTMIQITRKSENEDNLYKMQRNNNFLRKVKERCDEVLISKLSCVCVALKVVFW